MSLEGFTTEELATYMKRLFIAENKGRGDLLELATLPLDLLEECHYAIKMIMQAIRNKSEWLSTICANYFTEESLETMNWTVQEYVAELSRRNTRCRGRNEALEAEMMELFQPEEEELVADPCVDVPHI